LVVGVGFWAVKAWVQKGQRASSNDRAAADGNSPAALAKELHLALFSWSDNWPLALQDSDEGALLAIAPRIADLQAVSREYKRQYRRELLDDLGAVFNTNQMAAFRAALGKATAQNRNQLPPAVPVAQLAQRLFSCISATVMPCNQSALEIAAQVRDYPALKALYRQRYGRDLEAHLLSQWTFTEEDLARFRQAATGAAY
jgi:hypothetical protein